MRVPKNQVCTLWKKLSKDKEGKSVFAAPVEFMCRFEERNQKFQEQSGDERISTSVIYTDDPDTLNIGDWVARGSIARLAFPDLTASQMLEVGSLLGVNNPPAEIAVVAADLITAIEQWDEIAGSTNITALNKYNIVFREIRAKNVQPSIGNTEQLIKLYCQ